MLYAIAHGSAPRVRGTHRAAHRTRRPPVQPRACGERRLAHVSAHPGRFSPARAGNALRWSYRDLASSRFSPARAGNAAAAVVPHTASGSAPRVRGTLFVEAFDAASIFTIQRTHQPEWVFSNLSGAAQRCASGGGARFGGQCRLRREAHQPQTIKVNRNPPVTSAGIEMKSALGRSRPSYDGITVLDLRTHLLPDHFAHPRPIVAEVNAGPHLKQP